jgi:hypothetical protein
MRTTPKDLVSLSGTLISKLLDGEGIPGQAYVSKDDRCILAVTLSSRNTR